MYENAHEIHESIVNGLDFFIASERVRLACVWPTQATRPDDNHFNRQCVVRVEIFFVFWY